VTEEQIPEVYNAIDKFRKVPDLPFRELLGEAGVPPKNIESLATLCSGEASLFEWFAPQVDRAGLEETAGALAALERYLDLLGKQGLAGFVEVDFSVGLLRTLRMLGRRGFWFEAAHQDLVGRDHYRLRQIERGLSRVRGDTHPSLATKQVLLSQALGFRSEDKRHRCFARERGDLLGHGSHGHRIHAAAGSPGEPGCVNGTVESLVERVEDPRLFERVLGPPSHAPSFDGAPIAWGNEIQAR